MAVRETAGDLQWRVSTKVSVELYRHLLDLAELRGLDLGELLSCLICFGLEGTAATDRGPWLEYRGALARDPN